MRAETPGRARAAPSASASTSASTASPTRSPPSHAASTSVPCALYRSRRDPAGFQVEIGHGARIIGAGWDGNCRSYRSIGGGIVTVGDDLGDPDGAYRTWFTRHDTVAALQRPNFHLYGSATDATEAVDLLRHLREDLDPGHAARSDDAMISGGEPRR